MVKTRWPKKRPAGWPCFSTSSTAFLVIILILAAIISLFVADLKDFLVITVLILVNGAIGFWQELKAETSLEALKRLTESKVQVIRDAVTLTISSSDLVPGDCVLLSEGDLVTADLRLFETSALMIDESPLTCESLAVEKDHEAIVAADAPPYEYINSALSGTMVVRGSGKGFVVKTGKSTYFAGIAKLAMGVSPPSPFTRAMDYFSRRYIVILIGIFACRAARTSRLPTFSLHRWSRQFPKACRSLSRSSWLSVHWRSSARKHSSATCPP
jgi:Ca2+-transporting ATPase